MISQELLHAFQMRRHHLTPETKGRDKQDVVTILRDVGGLSWTAPLYHRMALWKRGINNIRLLPECYDEDSLSMILKGLEQEAELMGHKRIEIRNINDSPACFHLETSLGEMLLGKGYSLEGEWFIKHLADDSD
jgi:hypothetical protein